MKKDQPQEQDLLDLINRLERNIEINLKIGSVLDVGDESLNVFKHLSELLVELKNYISDEKLKKNYANQFYSDISNIQDHIGYSSDLDIEKHIKSRESEDSNWKINDKRSFRSGRHEYLQPAVNRFVFNLNFFKKIDFFNNNLVVIGANGSGKTTMADKFKKYLKNNGVVISAQRILLIPYNDTLYNADITANKLKESQVIEKSNREENEFENLRKEFSLVLRNLLAENIKEGHSYIKKSKENSEKELGKPIETRLDKTIKLWSSLNEHLSIECIDGMNLIAKGPDTAPYSVSKMSDGEKTMLYSIAQVLQAPENGFIVIDEPELYLHKTILFKLWDVLESERKDCLFIYLTHDLDFATSRITAKKVWVKSFIPPENWTIEEIPENEIPKSLLLKLLGSRKNILFCEGGYGKEDERIYSILFPEFTVVPVGGCINVINYTKAFNKLPNITTKAFGIIDSDHYGGRLDNLKGDNIFCLLVPEIESLLYGEQFLDFYGKRVLATESNIAKFKSKTIELLKKEKILQASNYVSAKIDFFLKDSNVPKGNNLQEVEDNFTTFSKKINIKEWYNERLEQIEEVINNNDYKSAIKLFNIKGGLLPLVKTYFGTDNFKEKAIELLKNDSESHKSILKFIPDEIKKAGRNDGLREKSDQ